MKRPSRKKLLRMAAIVVLVIAACWWLDWRLLQPKIHMATMEEIKAVLPKELLVERREDPAAQARYWKLIGLLASLGEKQVDDLMRSTQTVPPGERWPEGEMPPGPHKPLPRASKPEQYASRVNYGRPMRTCSARFQVFSLRDLCRRPS